MPKQNIPISGSLTFIGDISGSVALEAQPHAGSLQIMLPNVAPLPNQLLTAVAVNGFQVTLGWGTLPVSAPPPPVDSVNGHTGVVVLNAGDVGAATVPVFDQTDTTPNKVVLFNGDTWLNSYQNVNIQVNGASTFPVNGFSKLTLIGGNTCTISFLGANGFTGDTNIVVDAHKTVELWIQAGEGYTVFQTEPPTQVGSSLTVNNGTINLANVQVFIDNAAAITGGLVAGDLYHTGADPDVLAIVH